MPKTKAGPKTTYDLLTSGNIDTLRHYALNRIEKLQSDIERAQKEQRILKVLLEIAETCTGIAQQEAVNTKQSELRLEWKETIENSWISEAGSVCKKAWDKFEGFPNCWRDKAPYAEDDRSSKHMVHRPARDYSDDRTTDFDTLIDCQLAVERAHFGSLRDKLIQNEPTVASR